MVLLHMLQSLVSVISILYRIGTTSNKQRALQSGILNQLKLGDRNSSAARILIYDLLPLGVAINIKQFLETVQFTASQEQRTKYIAQMHILLERAPSRMEYFKL